MGSTPARPPRPEHPPHADIETGAVGLVDHTLTITGEVDQELIQAWERRHPAVPVLRALDTAQVSFFGSAGISYAIALTKAAAPNRIQLRQPSRAVLRALQLTGLDTLFDVSY